MAYTRRQLITQAFGELALAGYEFDITPEEQQDAARQMDAMLADWLADGINIGYSFALDPSGIDLDTDSGVPLSAVRTVYTGLAIAMAAGMGKTVAGTTQAAHTAGRSKLLRAAAFPPEQQLPSSLPRGAGAKTCRITDNPFMPAPDTGPLQIAQDGGLNLGN